LFLVGGLYVYLAVGRQIHARVIPLPDEDVRTFGLPDAILAFCLACFFLLNLVVPASSSGKIEMHSNDLILTGLVSLAVFMIVAAFLTIRGLSVSGLAGFATLPLWRALITGTILLFAAYPLIFLADLVSQRVLGVPSSKQGIVDLFNGSETLQQRVLIIILAVAIAPIVEEFIFRFFFYGVIKRYFGRVAGLLVSSGLFAAVHGHLPSAAPLFVLGACFALAYEWSGSILVSMTMHALFNSLTLTALAFPELLQP
jgi:membrane protease YdiL (CAAX protease family)